MRTHTVRRGMTLIEVVISAAIFATLMAMVAQSMVSAGRSSEVMSAKDDVTEVGGRVVHNLAFDLRDLALNADGTIKFSGPTPVGTNVVQYTYRIATGVAITQQPYGLTYDGYCDHDLQWDQAAGTLTQFDYNADDASVKRQSILLASNILPPPPLPGCDATKYPNGGFTITVNGRLLDVTLVLKRSDTFEGNQSEQWIAEQSAVFVRSTLGNAWGAQSNMSSGSNTSSNPATMPPVITSSNNASGSSGQPFSYQIVATNSPTKYGISGTLPSGLAISTATGLLSGTPTVTPSQTSFPLTMSAINSAGSGTASLTLDFTTATQQGPNVPVVTGDSVIAQLGSPFSYAITATNMSGRYHPVGYGATGLPPGVGISVSSGAITGTPTQVGTWTVQISATNTDGTGTATLVITVPTPAPPATPVVTGGTVTATKGTTFQYQISATHMTTADQPQGYAATNLPNGLSCDPASGLISGTPNGSTGSFNASLSATNAGGTGTATLTIAVQNAVASTAPVVTGATVSGTVGMPLVYTISATNMSSPYYGGHNGYATSAMPGGLNAGNGFNQNTGTFQGTPSVAGTFTVTVAATNSSGTGSNQITFVIAASQPTPTPVVTSQSLATQQYASFTYQISATNMTSQYSPSGYNATGLPAGLSFTASTGVISGAPTASGTYAIQISATNGGGTGSGTLTLTINAQSPPVPQVTGGSTTGQQTAAFSYQIQATNVSTSYAPVSFAATGLPGGLSCNASNGLISGTPTVNGSFNATLTVTNSYGAGTSTLMITVSQAPSATPVVTSTTQTIYKGVAASYTISATNMGVADGAVGYAASPLPNGFTCDAASGTISGTATATGMFTVTMTATNRTGTGTGTLTLSIVDLPSISFAPTTVETPVNNGNNPPVDVAGSKVTVSAPTNYTLTGDPSVSLSSTKLQYSLSTNSTGGTDVNFTGTLSSSASATVSATATRPGYPTLTGSYTIRF